MFEDLGEAINSFFKAFIVVVIIAVISVFGLVALIIKKSVIKSDHRIEPRIELVVTDNKVDTVYVYQK